MVEKTIYKVFNTTITQFLEIEVKLVQDLFTPKLIL